jgi:hypothetical protein
LKEIWDVNESGRGAGEAEWGNQHNEAESRTASPGGGRCRYPTCREVIEQPMTPKGDSTAAETCGSESITAETIRAVPSIGEEREDRRRRGEGEE